MDQEVIQQLTSIYRIKVKWWNDNSNSSVYLELYDVQIENDRTKVILLITFPYFLSDLMDICVYFHTEAENCIIEKDKVTLII